MDNKPLSNSDQRRIAEEASCDVRSVAKYLSGGTLRYLLGRRVEAAMRKLGLGSAVRR